MKHHANGKEDDELVEYEFREIVSTLEQESLKNKSRYVSSIFICSEETPRVAADFRSISSKPKGTGRGCG